MNLAWHFSLGQFVDISVSAALVLNLQNIFVTLLLQHSVLYVPSIIPFFTYRFVNIGGSKQGFITRGC